MRAAGGIPVPFADLLAPEFHQAPELLFARDQYHPSAAGYALAANQVIPALCAALGLARDEPEPPPALPSTSVATRAIACGARLLAISPLRRRPTTGVPAPVVPTNN